MLYSVWQAGGRGRHTLAGRMLNLMLITGDAEVARYAFDSGIGTIFVDLEHLGKEERQGGKDTVMNRHTLAEAAAIRRAVPGAELLVRLDPLHEGTEAQALGALEAGADLLMLPMWRTADEVDALGSLIGQAPCLIPLAETPEALECIREATAVPAVKEMYVGLNDLSLCLGLTFMFEPLASGMIDVAARAVHAGGKPFGFGGLARLGEGALDPRLVLAEHVRLGSNRVILSRAFHLRSTTLEEFRRNGLDKAVREVREVEIAMRSRTPEQVARDREALIACVRAVVARP